MSSLVQSLALALVFGAGCNLAQEAPSAVPEALAQTPATPTPTRPDPTQLVGSALPALPIVGLQGEHAQLGALDAKPTVLVLWSTWCEQCIHETAQLTAWANAHDDVRVLSVNVDGLTGKTPNPDKIAAYAGKLGLTGTVWTLDAQYLPELGLRTCPTSYIVDASGAVRAARTGYKGPEDMDHWLAQGLQLL